MVNSNISFSNVTVITNVICYINQIYNYVTKLRYVYAFNVSILYGVV